MGAAGCSGCELPDEVSEETKAAVERARAAAARLRRHGRAARSPALTAGLGTIDTAGVKEAARTRGGVNGLSPLDAAPSERRVGAEPCRALARAGVLGLVAMVELLNLMYINIFTPDLHTINHDLLGSLFMGGA